MDNFKIRLYIPLRTRKVGCHHKTENEHALESQKSIYISKHEKVRIVVASHCIYDLLALSAKNYVKFTDIELVKHVNIH